MKEQDLQSAAKISAMTIAKLGRNKNVNTEILQKICTALECDICGIMEMKTEEKRDD